MVGGKAAEMGGKAAVHTRNKVMEKVIVKEFVEKTIDLVIKSSCFLERAGLMGLVKRYTAKKAGSSAAEYVPLLRIAAAGRIEFHSTQSTLHEVLDEMHVTANSTLSN